MTTIKYNLREDAPDDKIKIGDWLLLEDKDAVDDEDDETKNLCVVSRTDNDKIALICIDPYNANRFFDPVLWSGSKGSTPRILESQLAKYKVTKVNVVIEVNSL